MGNNEEIMIRVQGLKKQYRLGQIGTGTLSRDLQSWWARKRGKEDPNTKIGTDQRLVGQTFMALNGLDFEIRKGEAVGIIGSNGAGKSTLLKLLTHVTAPTEGTIDMYGRVASMLEVGTGFHPEMTGRENVYLNGAILGMTKAEIDAKMDDIVAFSEVRDFIDTPVKRYSSGMYVKLAFAVAAHLDSEIMIMDEVLAVGDAKFQEKCLGKMDDEAHSGRTILYVSHNMNTVRQLCNRVIVLDQGKMVFDGETEQGIEIYSSRTALKNKQKLADLPRRPEFSVHLATMQDIELFTDENGKLPVGGTLRGKLGVTCERDIENVMLSLVLRHATDVPVTRAMTQKGFALTASGRKELLFEMDVSRLAPGRYRVCPVLNVYNSFHMGQSLDGLYNAAEFEIVETPEFNGGVKWQTQYSGFYVCPPLLVQD